MLALKILFWVCLFIVFYTYIGYGILLYIIIWVKRLFCGKPQEAVLPSDDELPTMTLLICAYNEEDVVAEKMENTLALDYPKDKFHIMWVTDGSNDRTNELLSAYPEVDVVFSPERRGKTAALKHGLQELKTRYVAFTDANTMINPGALREIARLFMDPTIGCVSGEKRVVAKKAGEVAAEGEGIYWRYETSMATPCAAGIIALYLQAAKYAGKTLNTAAIRDVLANTGIHDSYTTKKNFGPNGKIDALAGIKYILGDAIPTPELSVNPTSLTFTASPGQSVTKTFTVTGNDLTSNVTLSISGSNSFSVTPATITPAEAAAGKTVTVTYTPSAAGTHNATVNVASIGAESKTVSLTGTAAAVPTLNVNPDALTFSTVAGQSVTQTFTINGSNLSSGTMVYIAVEGADANYFSVDKTSITRTAAQNGATVTVTYRPTAGGNHNAVVTVSGGGAESKTVALTGTATEPVRTITVDPTSLSFEAFTGQTVTKTFTVTGTNLNGSLTLALNNANGIYTISRTSISASAAASGVSVTVTYKPTVAGTSNASVTISGGGADPKTVNLTGTASLVKNVPVMLPAIESYIGQTSFRADWTDETPVANVASYTLEVCPKPAAGGTPFIDVMNVDYRLIEGITPDKFYTVNDLTAGGTFLYRVKALYIDNTESVWSNIEEVTLLEAGHGYALGDVNHDGVLNITDVTLLINAVLNDDLSTVCTTCGDFNEDGAVNVTDVTQLISYINNMAMMLPRPSFITNF